MNQVLEAEAGNKQEDRLTCWVSIDQEELEEKEDPVLGSDGDEPVAELAIGWVLVGITGTRDHPLLQTRNVLSAVFCGMRHVVADRQEMDEGCRAWG